jgi:primosomal protein N'
MSNNIQYVQVAPCIPLKVGGHESYTYHTEHEAIPEGAIVRIPFGKRALKGVVIRTNVKKPRYPTKAITTVTAGALTKHQLEFAQWIATYAHGGLGYTLRLFTL